MLDSGHVVTADGFQFGRITGTEGGEPESQTHAGLAVLDAARVDDRPHQTHRLHTTPLAEHVEVNVATY